MSKNMWLPTLTGVYPITEDLARQQNLIFDFQVFYDRRDATMRSVEMINTEIRSKRFEIDDRLRDIVTLSSHIERIIADEVFYAD